MAEKASEVMRQQFQFFRKKMKADIEKQTKEAIAEMKKEQKE